MTASTASFIEYIIEQLEPLENITSGRFFGGTGLKCDGVQFAMLMDDMVFFVVDNTSRAQYETAGMSCFWYKTKTKKVNVKKYYQVPEALLDDQQQFLEWARQSVSIAKKLKK